jgi:hypothetical protein
MLTVDADHSVFIPKGERMSEQAGFFLTDRFAQVL